jgi:uncharacterized membrane protein
MNTYLVLKTIHIMSSVLLVGTGFGSAFYLFFTHRLGPLASIATVGQLVVRADWWFTTPTVIIQPITGIWMAHLAGWPLDTPWILVSLGLYALAGVCWLPVVWLQIRMARMSRLAADTQTPLPARYWHHARVWETLGYPAFIAMVGVFALMVLKPALW